MAVHRSRRGDTPPPPPFPMFEADSQNFASAPSVPRRFKLQNSWPAFGGDHRGTLGGGGSQPKPPPSLLLHPFPPPPPPFRPPPPITASLPVSQRLSGASASTWAALRSRLSATGQRKASWVRFQVCWVLRPSSLLCWPSGIAGGRRAHACPTCVPQMLTWTCVGYATPDHLVLPRPLVAHAT